MYGTTIAFFRMGEVYQRGWKLNRIQETLNCYTVFPFNMQVVYKYYPEMSGMSTKTIMKDERPFMKCNTTRLQGEATSMYV